MTSSTTSVLITGANRGLGLQTATELANRGWVVWLGSRNLKAGQEAARQLAAEGNVRAIQIDVTSDESVDAAVATIEASGTGLDVLINSAGIVGGDTGDPATTKADGFFPTFEVNVFGPARVTHAFIPMLRQSANPRIVMVSSGLGSATRTTDPSTLEYTIPSVVYTSAKAALNMLTIQYAKALTEIRVNAVDPGYTATDLNGHQGHKTVQEGARIIVEIATTESDGPTGGFFDEAGPVPW